MKKVMLAILAILALTLTGCPGGGGGGGGDDNNTAPKFDVAIIVIGDNNNNGVYDAPLDDVRMPFDGDEIIYYFDKLAQVPPVSAPQMTWDGFEHAYIELIPNVTAAELKNFWVLVAQPDTGAAATPGSWSPVFGVFLEITDKYGYVCTSLLVHYVNIGQDPDGNYIYAAQTKGLDTTTGCIAQDDDNRTVLFGF